MRRQELIVRLTGWISFPSVAAVFLIGVGLRALIDWANHYGPSGPGWSLRGNGALELLPLWSLTLLVAAIVVLLRRKWLTLPLLPLALASGTIVGGVFGI